MAAINRGHKRYFIEYKSDKIVCGYNTHHGGNASTIKSAKSLINRIRKLMSEYNPRDFRVYDSLGELDKVTRFVPCVYSED